MNELKEICIGILICTGTAVVAAISLYVIVALILTTVNIIREKKTPKQITNDIFGDEENPPAQSEQTEEDKQ